MLWENDGEKKLVHQPISPVNFVDYRTLHTSIADAAAWWRPQINLADDITGDPIRVTAVETSENLFRVLGVSPALGRGFSSDSTPTGTVQEAIISVSAWDPPTMAAVTATVAIVALAACVMPGRRAAGEDPAAVLRGD